MSFRRSRLEFNSPTKRAAFDRSEGICECHRVPELMKILHGVPCGRPLGTGNTEFHHIIADALRPDNSLDNAAALTKTCHAIVTPRDRTVIAQAKRRFDRHHGIRPTPREVIAGTVASGIARRMNGEIVDRETGLPWHERNRILQPAGNGNGIIIGVTPMLDRVPLIGSEPT